MYLPLELNTPLLAGGIVSWFVQSRSTDDALNKARRERGTLIASGFIAGGALMGVISAILKYAEFDWELHEWADSAGAEILALVMFCLISAYMIWDTLKAKKEDS